ncbi:MAG: DegT/DnrJ/EryC1/StrS family aminotransferase [Verrucomicrobiaceae bacterium]|nr:MAG: DegT/DnrJ/EryC1/StrS family aminotransferase [Verrucomicrobiaceae bacterium]
MKVPFLNLRAHHEPIREEILRAVAAVLDAGEFAGGPFVEAFEQDFAAFCGTRHAVAVGSGTDALWLALVAAGVGPGDEVITVPMSFIATVEAIGFSGAVPVFVDIDPETYTMDPARLEQAITPRTKAVMPVHLFGQTADMTPILAIAAKHGLTVIEDAAQAHGAEFKGRRAGSLGHAGCFSFYPAKNLGAIGEGGAVVTDDAALAEKVRMLRDHGQTRKYHHAIPGWNSRMDAIQAAVLCLKLPHLDRHNRMRCEHAARYAELLHGVENVILPVTRTTGTHVHHIHAIQVDGRDRVASSLRKSGIGHGIHYPVPIHLQPAYASLGHGQGDFPVSENCASRFLSLPMFPELDPAQIRTVAHALLQVIHEPAGI